MISKQCDVVNQSIFFHCKNKQNTILKKTKKQISIKNKKFDIFRFVL